MSYSTLADLEPQRPDYLRRAQALRDVFGHGECRAALDDIIETIAAGAWAWPLYRDRIQQLEASAARHAQAVRA